MLGVTFYPMLAYGTYSPRMCLGFNISGVKEGSFKYSRRWNNLTNNLAPANQSQISYSSYLLQSFFQFIDFDKINLITRFIGNDGLILGGVPHFFHEIKRNLILFTEK